MKKILILTSLVVMCSASDSYSVSVRSGKKQNARVASNLAPVATSPSGIKNSNNSSFVSPKTGNRLNQIFTPDGQYYWLDIITGEKWVTKNGVLTIYDSSSEDLIPLLGVNLTRAQAACASLGVGNYVGQFNPETNECDIPVVATNWSGDITKNGQVVMEYVPMGTQFSCSKNSFDQVSALRRSSQWVMPLLVVGSSGIGFGIDYAMDSKKEKQEQEALREQQERLKREEANRLAMIANKQVTADTDKLNAELDTYENARKGLEDMGFELLSSAVTNTRETEVVITKCYAQTGNLKKSYARLEGTSNLLIAESGKEFQKTCQDAINKMKNQLSAKGGKPTGEKEISWDKTTHAAGLIDDACVTGAKVGAVVGGGSGLVLSGGNIVAGAGTAVAGGVTGCITGGNLSLAWTTLVSTVEGSHNTAKAASNIVHGREIGRVEGANSAYADAVATINRLGSQACASEANAEKTLSTIKGLTAALSSDMGNLKSAISNVRAVCKGVIKTDKIEVSEQEVTNVYSNVQVEINKMDDMLSNLRNINYTPVSLTDDEYNSLTEKTTEKTKTFWEKKGVSGAVIGAGVGSAAALGFWAAEGASIRCNIAGLADIKLNKTYSIPSFKEYLIQKGFAQ